MSRSIPAKQLQLATQAFQLGFAAPQVIAHRMARMTLGSPSRNDRQELRLMSREKAEATVEAWNGMATQVVRSAQAATSAYWQAWWKAWMGSFFLLPGTRRPSFPSWAMTPGQLQHATLDVMGKALAPAHRRALANASRLGKTRRR